MTLPSPHTSHAVDPYIGTDQSDVGGMWLADPCFRRRNLYMLFRHCGLNVVQAFLKLMEGMRMLGWPGDRLSSPVIRLILFAIHLATLSMFRPVHATHVPNPWQRHRRLRRQLRLCHLALTPKILATPHI